MSDVPHTPKMSPAGDKPSPGPKRIYDQAAAAPSDDGFAIQLDGRTVKTPARNTLTVPSAAVADAIVQEWMAQGEHVDHQTMPMTRFANTALDNVRGREDEIVTEIAAFAGNDLLCYRGETPESLVRVQCEAWDPVLEWAVDSLNARFTLAAGVIHVPQPESAMIATRKAIEAFDAFGLTGLHNMTTLSGSAILALATAHEFIEPQDAWVRAHVDEDWQISQWGPDEEAAERRAFREGEFLSAYRFLTLHNAG